tara:strand:- start:69 stop:683 length:615 start_codon:yes stop_codon:yes gene_type:complete
MSSTNEEINEAIKGAIEVNENEPIEPKENMEKVKKPRTEKQKQALIKAQEKLKEKRELKKKELEIAFEKAKAKPNLVKPVEKNIVKSNDEVNEDSDDNVIEYVKSKPRKKKSKPRIIVEDNSSDSDQEIVISRRRRSKKQTEHNEGYLNDMKLKEQKTKPIDIPDMDENPVMEKQKTVKQSKSVEPINEEKKYSMEQILRAYGL